MTASVVMGLWSGKGKKMPRPIKVRDSYQGDVTYLSRLSQAVNKDDRMNEPWRKMVKRKINDLIVALMNSDGQGKRG